MLAHGKSSEILIFTFTEQMFTQASKSSGNNDQIQFMSLIDL